MSQKHSFSRFAVTVRDTRGATTRGRRAVERDRDLRRKGLRVAKALGVVPAEVQAAA